MIKLYSVIFAIGLGASLTACESKSCDEWANEMESKCCNGKSGCSLGNKADVVAACNKVADKCGSSSSVECSTTGTSSSSCPISCECK